MVLIDRYKSWNKINNMYEFYLIQSVVVEKFVYIYLHTCMSRISLMSDTSMTNNDVYIVAALI